jgi:CheY-like chemotaxis protein
MENGVVDLYLLVGILGGIGVGGLLVYLIMKKRVKSLRDELEDTQNRIGSLKNRDSDRDRNRDGDRDVKQDISIKPIKREPPSYLNRDRESKESIKRDFRDREKGDSRDKDESGSRDEEEDKDDKLTPTLSTTLDDLRTLSKAVEEVESLTTTDDIFRDLDKKEQNKLDLDLYSKVRKESSLPIFEKHFDETPDVKREDFRRFANRRILVAEDNPVNSKLILMLFSKSGIYMDVAENGLEALVKLKEAVKSSKPYDLVLMDVHMPKMDGLEATKAIRNEHILQDIPVLALTASTEPEEIESILKSGMNGFLNKPIKLGKIYTAFNIFLTDGEGEKSGGDSKEFKQEIDRGEPSRLKVLDTQKGLEYTNHDKSLYRTILIDFLKNYADAGDKFQKYIKNKEFHSLQSLIIDLEGLTGTIGADELYSFMKEISRSISSNGFENIERFAPYLQQRLDRLVNATKLYLN